MSLIPEQFINAVTSIGILVDEGSEDYIGSGFIVEKTLSQDLAVNLLITNKHVLEGKKEVLIRVINTDGIPIHVSIPLTKNAHILFIQIQMLILQLWFFIKELSRKTI